MKIAVASGKGGSGKTSVVAALTQAAQMPLMVLDCDVEAPNSHLLLPLIGGESQEVTVMVPQFRADLCGGCGRCVQFCRYNALVQFERLPMVLPELCHSCGGCARICPHKAIREVPRRVGTVTRFTLAGAADVSVVQGRLDVGQAMAAPVIRAVKKEKASPDQIVLIDAPPGTACAAATSVRGADMVLLVAEESRFGQHDLALAVDLVRAMGLPFSVLINRAVKGRAKVRSWCRRQGINVLAEIPENRAFAAGYARGQSMLAVDPAMRGLFADLWQKLKAMHMAVAA